jgi:hypothetical protein
MKHRKKKKKVKRPEVTGFTPISTATVRCPVCGHDLLAHHPQLGCLDTSAGKCACKHACVCAV